MKNQNNFSISWEKNVFCGYTSNALIKAQDQRQVLIDGGTNNIFDNCFSLVQEPALYKAEPGAGMTSLEFGGSEMKTKRDKLLKVNQESTKYHVVILKI